MGPLKADVFGLDGESRTSRNKVSNSNIYPTAVAIPLGSSAPALARAHAASSSADQALIRRYLNHTFVLVMAALVLAVSSLLAQRPAPDLSAASLAAAPQPAPNAITVRAIPATQSSAATLASIKVNTAKPVAPVVPQKPAPDLKTYVVTDGDNPYDLAASFGISEETLLAANSLNADAVLQIGQKLLVPPVSGIVISTQAGDTAKGIADQWKIDLGKLAAINHLDGNVTPLTPGSPLMLPGVTPPVQIYPIDGSGDNTPAAAAPAASSAAAARPAPKVAAVVTAAPPDTRPAVRRTSYNNFPWGQCTWWAANQRPDIGSVVVGNAASWLYSARSAGLPTGFVPRPGAVVVYQPGAQGAAWTGHVAYVTSVNGNSFTISEMNFPYFGVVTTRVSHAGPGVSFIY